MSQRGRDPVSSLEMLYGLEQQLYLVISTLFDPVKKIGGHDLTCHHGHLTSFTCSARLRFGTFQSIYDDTVTMPLFLLFGRVWVMMIQLLCHCFHCFYYFHFLQGPRPIQFLLDGSGDVFLIDIISPKRFFKLETLLCFVQNISTRELFFQGTLALFLMLSSFSVLTKYDLIFFFIPSKCSKPCNKEIRDGELAFVVIVSASP